MKNSIQHSLILLIAVIFSSTFGYCQQVQHSLLQGEVINRTSDTLVIRNISENSKKLYLDPVKIPITNGKFSYTLSFSEMEAYELVFSDELNAGSWRSITFFPNNEGVEFTLYPTDEWDKNVITGGELNAMLESYKLLETKIFGERREEITRVWRELMASNELNSVEYEELMKQIRNTKSKDQLVPLFQKQTELIKTNARYTEKAKQLYLAPNDSLMREFFDWKYEYLKNNVSIASYYLMWNDVEMRMKSNANVAQKIEELFPVYEKEYPDHTYTKLIGTQIAGLRTIKPGNKYIDLKAPTVQGDSVQLSGVIENRVALINMWGSWCGPCISKSRLIMPIYDKYKDQGFEVVGVAREFKTTDALKKRIDKEKYSWANLVDLDDNLGIWNLYGIANGVGLMVLVDQEGTILSVDPKPEELEEIVKTRLNQ